ncbi:MAG TPA: TonB-dependent receptor [Caulobacteraceae bacterium]|jgi:iron complex outermembrane receptor protein|nr:TonB-dependent receptor [Caulobacteraceae bacterium]
MRYQSFASASALALCAVVGASAARAGTPIDEVVVTGQRSPDIIEQPQNTTEGIDAAQIQATVNASTVEDELKYLPDIFIRQRHIGDTQDPITTRTSGVGSSARSLVYADGVLLSALIGNNNTNASPRWGMISPEEVQRIDILYGPFSAAFPGNSIGEVVQITTRTPDHLQGSASVEGAWQDFGQFGTHGTFPTGRASFTLGDRIGRFSFWLSADHIDSEAEPLLYVTAAPTKASAAAIPVTGGFAGDTRTGSPIRILGAGAREHQTEDNATLKLAYDLTPTINVAYGFGFFQNSDIAGVQTYLRNAAGKPVYSGVLNIAGQTYSVPASAFSNDRYDLIEDHILQSLSIGSHSGGTFDWTAIATVYNYLTDHQRGPSLAFPAGGAGGAGTITSFDGTGWETLDLKAIWRPQGADGTNIVSFGAHQDGFRLANPKYNAADWINGPASSVATIGAGKTETEALWAQDQIGLTSALKLTLGGRFEDWRAFDGLNFSARPALAARQPDLSADRFSPKAVLAFTPTADWRFTASFGKAYRFPTVTELYQSVTTGAALSVPNPDLKPEDAASAELAAERNWSGGRARVSLFGEWISDALISQAGVVSPAAPTVLASFTQNVSRVRNLGVEAVADQNNVLIKGLELSGWITFVDSRILSDSGFASTIPGDTAVGKQLPQLPRLRAGAVATFRPAPAWALTLAARYSDRSFGTIDNSDSFANTFQGFAAYFVLDAHARYQIDRRWAAELGVDNLTDRAYFLFHPFPRRTVSGKLSYAF